MTFKFTQAPLKGAYIIEPHCYNDNRGLYEKNFEFNIFKHEGINFKVTESSDLYTKKGAIRGLHYQEGASQAKLVRVIKGKVFDVIIDLRKESATYCKTFTIILDDSTNTSLYVPKGFAHGFLALEDSIFAYHCDGKYEPEKCGGLIWNDPDLDIDWPLHLIGHQDNLILSINDKNLQTLKEYENRIEND